MGSVPLLRAVSVSNQGAQGTIDWGGFGATRALDGIGRRRGQFGVPTFCQTSSGGKRRSVYGKGNPLRLPCGHHSCE